MAVKSSTLKLLAFLYNPLSVGATEVLFRSYEQLSYVLPELSAAGRRSLVAHAVKQGWVRTEMVGGSTRICLSSFGASLSKQSFPAFNEPTHSWYLCIASNPPKGDNSFRFLRSLLVKRCAAQLTRAVYLLSSGSVDQSLLDELLVSYRTSVVIVAVGKWVFGDEREVLLRHFALSDMKEVVSGISREVEQLLRIKNSFSELNDQQKLHLFSVFTRLYELLSKEMGLCSVLYPNETTFQEQWHVFQSLRCWQL